MQSAHTHTHWEPQNKNRARKAVGETPQEPQSSPRRLEHTHVENRETRTKQEKRLKENSSGTAELSQTSFGLLVENEQMQFWTVDLTISHVQSCTAQQTTKTALGGARVPPSPSPRFIVCWVPPPSHTHTEKHSGQGRQEGWRDVGLAGAWAAWCSGRAAGCCPEDPSSSPLLQASGRGIRGGHTHTHTLRTARQEQSKKSGPKKTPQEQQSCPRRLSVEKK